MNLKSILFKDKFGKEEQPVLNAKANLSEAISKEDKKFADYWFAELFKRVEEYEGPHKTRFQKDYDRFNETMREMAGY